MENNTYLCPQKQKNIAYECHDDRQYPPVLLHTACEESLVVWLFLAWGGDRRQRRGYPCGV